MAYERLVGLGIDYAPCTYGAAKLSFRGPRCRLDGDYVAYLGSTETYGKFVEKPFPDLVSEIMRIPGLNLGNVAAGMESFHDDPAIVEMCRGARATVIQAMGAHKQSNRLYRVHPRRNDRFLQASPRLRELYPEVDFADIHFARHLVTTLAQQDAGRFAIVRDELCTAWTRRLQSLIRAIDGPVILLWASDRKPEQGSDDPAAAEPLFVTRAMIDGMAPYVDRIVELPPRHRTGAPSTGMVCPEFDATAAAELPGPADHARIADALAPALQAMLASTQGIDRRARRPVL